MPNSELWLLREDPSTGFRRREAFEDDTSLGLLNSAEMDEALTELLNTRSMTITGDPIIPEGAPHPIISLPADLAPDYFELEGMIFVSQRFRDALGQPPDVVQYWPVKLTSGSDQAWQQDYLLMRVLAWQPAMDLNKSVSNKRKLRIAAPESASRAFLGLNA